VVGKPLTAYVGYSLSVYNFSTTFYKEVIYLSGMVRVSIGLNSVSALQFDIPYTVYISRVCIS